MLPSMLYFRESALRRKPEKVYSAMNREGSVLFAVCQWTGSRYIEGTMCLLADNYPMAFGRCPLLSVPDRDQAAKIGTQFRSASLQENSYLMTPQPQYRREQFRNGRFTNHCCTLLHTGTALQHIVIAVLCAFYLQLAMAGRTDAADEILTVSGVDFNRQIRPLLSDRCISCHGPDEAHREANLRLDSIESLTRDRDGRQVVRPGDAAASELIRRIESQDPDLQMPPPDSGKALSSGEIEQLRKWINNGAVWQQHWAYEMPIMQTPPGHGRPEWSRNWIDDYISARLQTVGIQPAPDAQLTTLIRRLHFDLTGLPPTTKTLQQMQSNDSQESWQDLVDQLLASDAFAERMAMFWLDLVRYADTVGYHGDQDHNISPYRDWVIDAFALGMPFDQFTREQLAGDLLPDSTTDQKIASGYNRLLQTTHEGGLQPKEYLAIYAADRVRNVSAVWLGATVGCAQCHDHKFDPYSSKDFYSLAAFFADLDEEDHFKSGTNSLPTKRSPELRVLTRREREQLLRLKKQLDTVTSERIANPTDLSLVEREKQLKFAIEDLEASARLTMISAAKTEPRVVRILPRGNWLDESGPVVMPAIPEFMGKLPEKNRNTRLDLANWLVDAEDGVGLLTARVMVNRLWALMFGSGISTSLEDFGGQGSPPDHPELLDRLAIEFVRSGWDVKHLLRLMANSRTYQQASAERPELNSIDPNNRLFARQSSFRLPAEMIRDNALQVAELLVHQTGGPSVRPYQPAGYYRHLNFPVRKYASHTDDRQWRRGIYVHWQRQFLHPMLRAFDAPSREECTAERPRSNTPLAALTLLNDPTFVEAARGFATWSLNSSDHVTDVQGLQNAFKKATSRKADATEIQSLQALLNASRDYYERNPDSASELISVGIAEKPNHDLATVAAWTTVCRVLLNLDETITRY